MKPTFQQDLIESTMQSDYDFTIKQSAHAFQVLSNNLYSDKILAVVREYLTNALDAQIASGVKTSFSVTLPSTNELLGENYWKVRDYGTGLSEEDIKKFYCTYFSSSKQSSNDYTGMLGLGCKSAFAYTQEFTVTSWFKGVKTDYFIFMENGLPKLTKLASEPSDEPNGLMVTIYVKKEDVIKFISTTKAVLEWFPQEYVPATLKTDLEPAYESDNCMIIKNVEYKAADTIYCLMGNVRYFVNLKDFNNYDLIYTIQRHNYNVILKFPIGSLSILPSREGLSLDTITKKTLQKKINICVNELKYKQKQDSPKKPFDSAQKIGNVYFTKEVSPPKSWDLTGYLDYQRIGSSRTMYACLPNICNYVQSVSKNQKKNYFIVVPSGVKMPVKRLNTFNEGNVFVLKYSEVCDKKRIYKFLRKYYSGKIYNNFKDFIKEFNIKNPISTPSKPPAQYPVQVYKRKYSYTYYTTEYFTVNDLKKVNGVVYIGYILPTIFKTFPDMLDGKDVYFIHNLEIKPSAFRNNSFDFYKTKQEYLNKLASTHTKSFIHALFIHLFKHNFYCYTANKDTFRAKYFDIASSKITKDILEHYSYCDLIGASKNLYEDKLNLAYNDWIKELFVNKGLKKVFEAIVKQDVMLSTTLTDILNISEQELKQHMENYICKILKSLDTQ